MIFHSPGRTHNFSFYESESFLIFGLSIETVADDHRGRPGIVCGVTGQRLFLMNIQNLLNRLKCLNPWSGIQ